VEFASGSLGEIAGLYAAPDEEALAARARAIEDRFAQMEGQRPRALVRRRGFGLVDAAWAPVFRYLDAFERLAGLRLAEGLPGVAAWRAALAARPSVAGPWRRTIRSGWPRSCVRGGRTCRG
jgi:glutathione S-transferase